MQAPAGDGNSISDHVASVERQLGKSLEGEGKTPTMPIEVAYLWVWWVELDHARGGSGFGVNPVSFSELAAWMHCTRIRLEPWEARAIRAIDKAYIAQMAKS